MWEELQSSINSYFDTLETTIRQSSSTYSNELLKSLKSRIDLYINRYQSIVKDISAQQAKEAAQIDEMQKAIDTDTREIKDRKKRLSERRYKLAAIDVKF